MFNIACVRRSKISSVWEDDELFHASDKGYAKCGETIVAKREALRLAGQKQGQISITSHDGLKLSARLIPCEGNVRPIGIIAMFHGFRSNPTHDFGTFAMDLHSMGFMLLMVDQRAHGGSEGRYITYGAKERLDVLEWCKMLSQSFPDLPVLLFGLSMGASSVLMASSLELPANVKGIVADCGYTTPDAICRKVLKEDMKLPVFPLFYTSRLLAKLAAGFDFKEVSAPDSAAASELPILIYHGEGDKFVPHSMGIEIKEAIGDRCTFCSIPEAGHGEAYLYDKERYLDKLRKFSRSAGFKNI